MQPCIKCERNTFEQRLIPTFLQRTQNAWIGFHAQGIYSCALSQCASCYWPFWSKLTSFWLGHYENGCSRSFLWLQGDCLMLLQWKELRPASKMLFVCSWLEFCYNKSITTTTTRQCFDNIEINWIFNVYLIDFRDSRKILANFTLST